jgi:4-alpha-glucanotransferase
MAEGQHSPYSAMTAMAIDPIYIALDEVEEFEAVGGEGALSDDDRCALAAAREAPPYSTTSAR